MRPAHEREQLTLEGYAEGAYREPTRAEELERRGEQLERVRRVMIDGRWHTLAELSHQAHAPEASASARLRDLRNRLGLTVERRHLGRGLYEYRVLENEKGADDATGTR